MNLRSLLLELEYKDLDQSKLNWEITDTESAFGARAYLPGYDSPVRKRHIPSSIKGDEEGWFGGMSLSKANFGQDPGFLTIGFVEVAEPRKGFGKLLFKKVLDELHRRGYKGIASQKDNRSPDANNLWKKIAMYSDDKFDYVESV